MTDKRRRKAEPRFAAKVGYALRRGAKDAHRTASMHGVPIYVWEDERVVALKPEEAQREPVAITSYGRVSGHLVSAREYEELQRLRAFERRVHRIKGLPAEIVEAIQTAKMNSVHDHLNALLDESQKEN